MNRTLSIAATLLLPASLFAQDNVAPAPTPPEEIETSFVRIGDIAGESQEAREKTPPEYITITLVPLRADDHSAGDEHEITYDLASGAFAGGRPTRLSANAGAQAGDSNHDKWVVIESFDWGASSGPGGGPHVRVIDGQGSSAASSPPTGKRQHRPLAVTKRVDRFAPGETMMTLHGQFGGCALGTKFSNITLKRGLVTYAMEGVEVVGCSATAEIEHVTLKFEEIKIDDAREGADSPDESSQSGEDEAED